MSEEGFLPPIVVPEHIDVVAAYLEQDPCTIIESLEYPKREIGDSPAIAESWWRRSGLNRQDTAHYMEEISNGTPETMPAALSPFCLRSAFIINVLETTIGQLNPRHLVELGLLSIEQSHSAEMCREAKELAHEKYPSVAWELDGDYGDEVVLVRFKVV